MRTNYRHKAETVFKKVLITYIKRGVSEVPATSEEWNAIESDQSPRSRHRKTERKDLKDRLRHIPIDLFRVISIKRSKNKDLRNS